MFNIGTVITFDYVGVDSGKVSKDRQVTIESVKPYMHTQLIVGKSFDENGKEKFRTFHQDKMTNVRVS